MKNVLITFICSKFLNFGSINSQKTIFLAARNGSWSLMYIFFLFTAKSHEVMYTVPLKMAKVQCLSGRLGSNAQKAEIRQA